MLEALALVRMSDQEKQKAVDDFQGGKCQVGILNMIAGGVGVTLTKARVEVIIDYAWIPSEMTQVEDRICRSGQTECCTIYYVYCTNSIFDKIFVEMLAIKSWNIDNVVDGIARGEDNSYDLVAEKSEHTTYIDLLKAAIENTK